MKNTKLKILSLIVLVSFLLSACSNVPAAKTIGSGSGQTATVRDAVYSLEPRLSGAFVMWLRYDDEGVYCITDKAMYDKALHIMTEGSGWAVITYYTLYQHETPENLVCKSVEGTPRSDTTSATTGDHTIYIVKSITETTNDQ